LYICTRERQARLLYPSLPLSSTSVEQSGLDLSPLPPGIWPRTFGHNSKFPKIINRFYLANSHRDSFILLRSTVISAVDLRETSASDIGVSGGEDTSLLSLLCLDSNNLFTVIIGVR